MYLLGLIGPSWSSHLRFFALQSCACLYISCWSPLSMYYSSISSSFYIFYFVYLWCLLGIFWLVRIIHSASIFVMQDRAPVITASIRACRIQHSEARVRTTSWSFPYLSVHIFFAHLLYLRQVLCSCVHFCMLVHFWELYS